ncbi:MAG: transposase [Myxococcales bacterium]|nr:transposase [Myxococcales bacterium]
MTSKFALGTPHYRLEQALADQGLPLDRGLMSRYVEHAGNTLGATIVAAMWRDAIANGHVISTDATGALIQPTKARTAGRLGAEGHFFTAVVDADACCSSTSRSTPARRCSSSWRVPRVLQADASAVYDILERGPPKGYRRPRRRGRHARRVLSPLSPIRFFEAALCRYAVRGCRGSCASARSSPPIARGQRMPAPSARRIAPRIWARCSTSSSHGHATRERRHPATTSPPRRSATRAESGG